MDAVQLLAICGVTMAYSYYARCMDAVQLLAICGVTMAPPEFIRERVKLQLNGGTKEKITILRIKACPQTDQRGGQYVREGRNA
jgi:hypothetical protein